MLHLRSIAFHKELRDLYPYNLPIFQDLEEIGFQAPVTIFVGENGSGKSTILEAIATGAESIPIGGSKPSSAWEQSLKLSWSVKTKKGFYFKATDFIQFIDEIKQMKAESKQALQEISLSEMDPLAKTPHARTLHELENLYGEGLEFRSHGESFLDLFQARFQPNGLYILDEPEAPLSPLNQLALIALIKDMLEEEAQFIIATHSPILMAFPGAEILSIEDGKLEKIAYDELEHVMLTRDFLNNPESFLRHL
jgi:predicted ATPase